MTEYRQKRENAEKRTSALWIHYTFGCIAKHLFDIFFKNFIYLQILIILVITMDWAITLCMTLCNAVYIE